MSNLENIIHGVGIPFSALTSVIFGLMIVSFPLGAYAIFISEIGDDIDYNFPLEKFDMFIAGYINEAATAIGKISFKFSSGNIDAGTIKMYGVK